jgi:membrane-bound lytic murein transglycosylase B
MTRSFTSSLLAIALISSLVGGYGLFSYQPVYAQEEAIQQAQNDRALLEAELASLEAQIREKQELLKSQQGQSLTIQREIDILRTKIGKAQLDIKAKNLTIKKLGGEITERKNKIESLLDKIDREKESLAQLVRKSDEYEERNLVHLILSKETVSSFYEDLNSFTTIKGSIKKSVDSIRGVQQETETEKQLLEEKQNQEEDAKAALERAKREVEKSQAEQSKYLAASKGKEKDIQVALSDIQKKVDGIKAKLVNLAGVDGPIRFDVALQYAEEAERLTGVRPAFLISLVIQESNLGANVGKCRLTVPETGEGVRVSNGQKVKLMRPGAGIAYYLELTRSLGRDPFTQVVSCPLSSGYGGAMGPSQFIPSTWKMYASKIQAVLGVSGDPWNPRHAFIASAVYLKDLGAASQTFSAEKNAACKYYSGKACGSYGFNGFYGTQVMNRAEGVQDDIDYLKQYGVSKR